MAFGPKFDILVSTVSSRSITEQLTARTIFNLYSRILRRGFYRFLRFLIENSLPCITIPPNMVAFIHTLFLVILLPLLHIQIFFNQVSCVSFTTLYVPLLLAIQKHANHFFVASCSCHPKLWQHSSSHNFYLAGRFAVSVSIQQLILQSSREYPYNEYELYSVIYRYIHHGDICDYCFCFF